MVYLAWAWWHACDWLCVVTSNLRSQAWTRAVELEVKRAEP